MGEFITAAEFRGMGSDGCVSRRWRPERGIQAGNIAEHMVIRAEFEKKLEKLRADDARALAAMHKESDERNMKRYQETLEAERVGKLNRQMESLMSNPFGNPLQDIRDFKAWIGRKLRGK